MTARDDLDRLITVWLDETAGARTPDYLDETLTGISRMPQRPAWASPGRWLPMELARTRLHVRRAVPILALIAAVIVALVAAPMFIGSHRRLPPPFGLAATGQFVFDSGGDLFVANADGSGTRLLIGGADKAFGATWSRDGTHVAYWLVGVGDQAASLWISSADGLDSRPVSIDVLGPPGAGSPAGDWSPDGETLAFAAGGQVYLVNRDGSDLRLLGTSSIAADPAWSPNGQHIAFYGETANAGPGVFVIGTDGHGEARISERAGSFLTHKFPTWSPDGTAVIYHTGPEGDTDVAVARLESTGWRETVVVGAPTNDSWPRFSNDGTQISFLRSEPSDHGHLVVAKPDGTSERLIASRLIGWAPHCWAPDDRSIIAVTAEQNVAIGDEPEPGFVVLSVDGSGSPVFIAASDRQGFAACSWQRLPFGD